MKEFRLQRKFRYTQTIRNNLQEHHFIKFSIHRRSNVSNFSAVNACNELKIYEIWARIEQRPKLSFYTEIYKRRAGQIDFMISGSYE